MADKAQSGAPNGESDKTRNSQTGSSKPLLHQLSFFFTATAFLVLVVVRFSYLEQSPPGFFVDEVGSAAHIVCLQAEGKNCNGETFTLYSRTWGDGRIGPIQQYAGWFWAEVFGSSIASLRALSAFFGCLTVIMLFVLCRTISSPKVAAWVALSALLSPWGFHASRIAWDPPLAPVFVVAMVLFLYRASEGEKWIREVFFASLCAALAALTYPPVAAHAAFLTLLLFLFQRFIFSMPFRRWLVFGTLVFALVLPVKLADTSTVQGRTNELAIWSNNESNPTANKAWPHRVSQFGENIGKHFAPSYLFLKGEYNFRHTVPKFGIFSWLDMFALAGAFLLIVLTFMWKGVRAEEQYAKGIRRLVLIGFFGYLSATMAASLTWDSIPHGLRSLSGWPFAALLAGACLSYISRFQGVRIAAISIALWYAATFSHYYFGRFQEDGAWWFDRDVSEALTAFKETGDSEAFRQFLKKRQYPGHARKYYLIHYLKEDPEI